MSSFVIQVISEFIYLYFFILFKVGLCRQAGKLLAGTWEETQGTNTGLDKLTRTKGDTEAKTQVVQSTKVRYVR